MSEHRTISQLRAKLSLLIQNGHFGSWEEIATVIGTKAKTLESWADYGSDKTTPGLVPAKHFESVIDAFAKALATHHAQADVEVATKGSVHELTRLLSSKPRYSFHELVNRETIVDSGVAYIDKRSPLSAVKRRTGKIPVTEFSVTTKQWFWIEFQTDIASNRLIALQQRNTDWAPVSVYQAKKTLYLPGLEKSGFPDSMREEDWEGLNSFFVLQISKPWTNSILGNIKNQTPIDGNFLQEVADHFMTVGPDQRRLFKLDLTIRAN